jgi:hypothetical protein
MPPNNIKKKPRLQVGVRCTPDEVAAAKLLGNGNISQGFRAALRNAIDRKVKPMSLYLTLRACAEMARMLEEPRR